MIQNFQGRNQSSKNGEAMLVKFTWTKLLVRQAFHFYLNQIVSSVFSEAIVSVVSIASIASTVSIASLQFNKGLYVTIFCFMLAIVNFE